MADALAVFGEQDGCVESRSRESHDENAIRLMAELTKANKELMATEEAIEMAIDESERLERLIKEAEEEKERLRIMLEKYEYVRSSRPAPIDMVPQGFRPLAEPPILAYNKYADRQEEIEKSLKKKGMWNNTALRQLVEAWMHQEVLGEYRDLVEDMSQEAITREDMNSARFYNGLVKAMVDDFDEDIDEIGGLIDACWQVAPWAGKAQLRKICIDSSSLHRLSRDLGERGDEEESEVWFSTNEEEPNDETS